MEAIATILFAVVVLFALVEGARLLSRIYRELRGDEVRGKHQANGDRELGKPEFRRRNIGCEDIRH